MNKIITANLKNDNSLTVLNLGGNDLPQNIVFQNYNIEVIYINEIIENNAAKFIEDYRDLIGRVSGNLDVREWWATRISSKNRFNSRIPNLLRQIEACSVVLDQRINNTVIYCPDYSIVSTINILTSNTGLKLEFPRVHVACKLWNDKLKALLIHVWSFINLSYKIFLIRFYFKKNINHQGFKKLNTYTLKTFFYESSIDKNNNFSYHDPMFGRLPEFLAVNGNLLIITQILGNYKKCLDRIKKNKEYTIIPIEYWLSMSTLFKGLRFLLIFRFDKLFNFPTKYRGININKLLKSEIFRNGNDIPLNQYLYYEAMTRCFRNKKIDQYVSTYENNPWEKMAILGIRQMSPLTKIVGFQQSVVPQASVNVFLSAEELQIMPLPDKIICVGKTPAEIINENSAAPMENIDVGCGLRYEYLWLTPSKKRKKIRKVLVAPEGVADVIPMINKVIKELNNNMMYHVSLRFHPSLPYENIKDMLDYNLENYKNIVISSLSLQEDLIENDLCIYWGSTVALEAMSMGIPLIHYNMQTILSYDPLYCCTNHKWTVTEKESLIDVIESINALSDEEYAQQAKQAKSYIARYFFPVNDENMSKFLYN